MIDKTLHFLEQHADWFDIIKVSGSSTPVSFKNNRVHSILEKQNSGYGIRVNKDGKTGFSYTNNKKSLLDTAKTALELSSFGDKEPFTLPPQIEKEFEPYSDGINHFSLENEIQQCEATIKQIVTEFPNATIDMSINKSKGDAALFNSSGFANSYKNSYYSISISVSDVNDSNKIDIGESTSGLKPVDYSHLVERILFKLKNAHNVSRVSSGKIPVIFTPKAFARILGIVAGGLNSRAVHKGISPFINKIDQKMFDSSLSIIDNPTVTDSPFSFPYDDEGIKSEKKYLIVNGIIENFIADLKYAEKLNIKPGNASRGYASLPGPSFSNIEIPAGPEEYNNLLHFSEKVILADQFIGFGQSNTLSGDFSANLDLGYVIEKGKITGRVKDCMLSDNIYNLLADDILLAKERETVGSIICPYVLLPAVNFTS